MGLIGWVLIGVVILAAVFLVALYNNLVRLRALAKEGFSGITVQLRRRADLVPNLVETVKGYATHERDTLDQVTARRAEATTAKGVAETAAADNAMTGMLRQLFAVAEAYPQLQANQNFLALQEELTGTEGRIAFSRQFYNEQVLSYDNARETFPTSIVAGVFNFEERAYFETEDDQSRQPVAVDFGTGGGGTPAAPASGASVPPPAAPPTGGTTPPPSA